jgi:flagellar hook-associated protein 3 FlgL
MNSRVKLYRIEQHQKNVESAQAWIKLTESSVLEMNEVVKKAYESTVQVANDHMTPEDKNAVAELIGQLRDHLVTIGNSKNGGKYIFGGYNTVNPPFTIESGTGKILYNKVDMSNASSPALIAEGQQEIEYEIGFSLNTKVSIPGTELMGTGDNNIYAVFDGLYNALKNDKSASEIQKYVGKLKDCQSHLMNIEGKIGGRTNRIDLVKSRLEEDHLNYTKIKSDVEDVDLAEAWTRFNMTATVYEAALKVSSKIIQPTLVDFLR